MINNPVAFVSNNGAVFERDVRDLIALIGLYRRATEAGYRTGAGLGEGDGISDADRAAINRLCEVRLTTIPGRGRLVRGTSCGRPQTRARPFKDMPQELRKSCAAGGIFVALTPTRSQSTEHARRSAPRRAGVFICRHKVCMV